MAKRKIFLSYAREQLDAAVAIESDIANLGWDAWYDDHLVAGQAWWDTILENIETSDVFVIILSTDYHQSVFCTAELNYATTLNKTLLPVNVGNYNLDKIPYELAGLQVFDYTKPDVKQTAFDLREVLLKIPQATNTDTLVQRPPLPRTALQQIEDQLNQSQLSPQSQQGLVFAIRENLDTENPQRLQDAIKLFRGRRDLLAPIASELDSLSSDISTSVSTEKSIKTTIYLMRQNCANAQILD